MHPVAPPLDPAPGDSQAFPARIGPYRILAEAGRGGMGTVYLAERDDGDFQKRVALKVIRDDAALPQLVRRFLDERRILASLEHPAIALLLDGGVTPSGAPFYAMEFVDGVRIDQWCDEAGVDLTGRIRLFLQVCEAVAYAHRNLVVHRDLKPANILVTKEGQAKLLDFGIARLLTPEAGGGTTVLGLRVLTPEYASPEQLAGDPVTTTSDVYSLGVLLHELLTGSAPDRTPPSLSAFPGLSRAGAEMRTDPSTLVRRTGGAELARRRGTTPQGLAHLLKGDLDAILRQALAPEVDARYGTVEALAADLRRHLEGRPVLARQGNNAYLIRRFIHRHRLAFGAAAGLVVAGLGLGAAHTRAVSAQRDQALLQAERADQVSDFLIALFAQSDPLSTGAGPTDVREFLELGTERLRQELSEQPEVRASLLRALGRVQDNLGNYEEADRLFQEALQLRLATLPAGHDDTAEVLQDLGALRRRQGAFVQADSLLQEVLLIREGARPSPRLVETLEELGGLRLAQGDLAQADLFFQRALSLHHSASPPNPRGVADVLTALGVVARQQGEADRAEQFHREALESRQASLGPEHVYVSESMKNLALTFHSSGRYAEARELYEGALAMQLRLLGEVHPIVASTRNSLGALLRTLGETEAAAGHYRQALETLRVVLGEAHPDLALTLTNLATVLRDQGELQAAESHAREALEMRSRFFAPDHPAVAQSLNILGGVLRGAGRLEEAESFLLEADGIYVARLGPDHTSVAINRTSLAFVLLDGGRAAEAEELFRSALDIHLRGGRQGHPDTVRPLLGLGQALAARGEREEAVGLLREALELQRSHFPEEHADTTAILEELEGLAAAGALAGPD